MNANIDFISATNCKEMTQFANLILKSVLSTFAQFNQKLIFRQLFFKILPYFWIFSSKLLLNTHFTLMYVWTHLGFSLDWSFNRHWQLKLRLNQATSYLLSRRWFRLLTTIEVALEKFFGKSENYRLVPYSIRDNFPLPNF